MKTAKIYADLGHLWVELATAQLSARQRRELLATVQTKLPEIKYFKLMSGVFIKVGAGIVEILDLGGLPEGKHPHLILGTLAGWCASLQFIQLASAEEYLEALDVVLEAEVRVLLIEKVSPC